MEALGHEHVLETNILVTLCTSKIVSVCCWFYSPVSGTMKDRQSIRTIIKENNDSHLTVKNKDTGAKHVYGTSECS